MKIRVVKTCMHIRRVLMTGHLMERSLFYMEKTKSMRRKIMKDLELRFPIKSL